MGQYWAVIAVLVGALVLSQNGIGIAQPYRNGYACWGGCYNVCILQTGKNPAERLPCYLQCLGSCIAYPESDNRYYCQLGCSLDQCIRFSSDSLIATKLILEGGAENHPQSIIIKESKELLEKTNSSLAHSDRSTNECADHLPHLGVEQGDDFVVIRNPPISIREFMIRDSLGTRFILD